MSARERMREEDLARRVIEWLQVEQWIVWQEVSPAPRAPVCDIVAKRGAVIWAIECKTTASLEVLDQARGWTDRANYVSVAVPHRRTRYLYENFARSVGLGVLWVDSGSVTDVRGPYSRERRGQNRWSFAFREFLTEERRLWPAAAGNNRSERWTDFHSFCHSVMRVVHTTPGISLRQAIAEIENHHYSSDVSARQSLRFWAMAGKVPDVQLYYVGRTPTLWPAIWTEEQIEEKIASRGSDP